MASVDINQSLAPRSQTGSATTKQPENNGKSLPPEAPPPTRSQEPDVTAKVEKDPATVAVEAVAEKKEQQNKLQDAVTRLNDYVQSVDRELHFQLDDRSESAVITVVDSGTKEVVRQIPSELALELAQKLNEEEPLRLFSAHV
jgi:flagellar protein FlaG